MVEAEEGQSWIYKNKDHGMFSAAASLGVSLLWDTDVGLSQIDKYAYATEEHIKVSRALGCFGSWSRLHANDLPPHRPEPC